MSVVFCARGIARPAGSKTIGRKKDGSYFIRDASGSKGTAWRKVVRQEALSAMRHRTVLDGPLNLTVTFFVIRPASHWNKSGLSAEGRRNPHPTSKPDLTKLLRAVEDACTGVIWKDDSQIVKQVCYKKYCREMNGVPSVLVIVDIHKEDEVVHNRTEASAGGAGNGVDVRGAEEDHPSLFPRHQ